MPSCVLGLCCVCRASRGKGKGSGVECLRASTGDYAGTFAKVNAVTGGYSILSC